MFSCEYFTWYLGFGSGFFQWRGCSGADNCVLFLYSRVSIDPAPPGGRAVSLKTRT